MATKLKAKMTRVVLVGLTALMLAGGHAAVAPAEADAAVMIKWTCQ